MGAFKAFPFAYMQAIGNEFNPSHVFQHGPNASRPSFAVCCRSTIGRTFLVDYLVARYSYGSLEGVSSCACTSHWKQIPTFPRFPTCPMETPVRKFTRQQLLRFFFKNQPETTHSFGSRRTEIVVCAFVRGTRRFMDKLFVATMLLLDSFSQHTLLPFFSIYS